MNILDKIVDKKRKEVRILKSKQSVNTWQSFPFYKRPVYSLRESLLNEGPFNIIAEFKRRSPSKSQIASQPFDPATIARAYKNSGARAISVLTDKTFFGGSLNDLEEIRRAIDLPLLRKDFIIDEIQLHEAKAHGADIVLLIASILEKTQIEDLTHSAKELGLEVLCELHEINEVEKLNDTIDIIGINNRNLKTFKVDFKHSIEMRKHLPADAVCISESGISQATSLVSLSQSGFKGFLIGEAFMKQDEPGDALKKMISSCEKIDHAG